MAPKNHLVSSFRGIGTSNFILTGSFRQISIRPSWQTSPTFIVCLIVCQAANAVSSAAWYPTWEEEKMSNLKR